MTDLIHAEGKREKPEESRKTSEESGKTPEESGQGTGGKPAKAPAGNRRSDKHPTPQPQAATAAIAGSAPYVIPHSLNGRR